MEGRRLTISNPGKLLWPRAGLTKAWLVDYYTRVAPVLLPHLAGHPVTLHRFPEGVQGSHWYQTRAPAHPDWVETATVRMAGTGKVLEICVVNDLPSLVWAAQVAAIELHPYLGTAGAFDRPTAVVFDLDPGPPATIVDCCRVALQLRDRLLAAGLDGWAKTSGGYGLHVHVPLHGPASFPATKGVARSLARALEEEQPHAVTSVMSRAGRAGKVFVDWSQNDAGKSIVAPYSLRGRPLPTVALPISWDEVDSTARSGDPASLLFFPAQALVRAQSVSGSPRSGPSRPRTGWPPSASGTTGTPAAAPPSCGRPEAG